MDIYKMLDLLEKIESETAGLYKELHEEHRENRAVSEFFLQMQMEEEAHARIVGMERRIVQSAPKSFSEPQVNLSEINNLLAMIANVKAEKPAIPELIRRLYSIESCMAEKYLIDALKDTNEEIRDFLLQLGDTCANHHKKVAAFAGGLGIRVEDAETACQRSARVGYPEKVLINGTLSVRASDISEGGMFLLAGRTFPVRSVLTLQFTVLEKPVTAEAAVQYVFAEVGMGVMFTAIPESDRQLIAEYVARRIEKGQEKQKQVLLVGSAKQKGRDMRIHMNELLGAGYRVVEMAGFEEALAFIRKGRDLSCAVFSVESETDINYYLLHFLSTLENYKSLPVLVLTGNHSSEFREALANKGIRKVLARLSTSPKKLTEEVNAATA
jgi:hypothetical protein